MKRTEGRSLTEFRLNLPRSPQIPRNMVDLVRRICEAVGEQELTAQWLDARECHRAFKAAHPKTPLGVRQMDEFLLKLFAHTDRLVIDRFEIHSAAQDVNAGKNGFKMKRVYSFRANPENLQALVGYLESETEAPAEEVSADAMAS